jgi:hypothetical protein
MVDGRENEEEGQRGSVGGEKLLVVVLLCHTRYTTEMR